MARPPIISDDVLVAMVRIARNQPVDMNHEVSLDMLVADDAMIAKGYTYAQLASAVTLLARNYRITDLGRALYKVPVPPTPFEGFQIPKLFRDLRVSDEAIFFNQMSSLICRRALA
jgi:hypothetical protein